jgi:hypothetical protein
MFSSVRTRAQMIVAIGIVGALALVGVAAAQGGPQGGQGSQQGSGHPAGPPPLPLPTQGLTYAQLHINKNGQEQTIRVDVGKVVAAGESSISLSENDGSEVTIPVDQNTEVMGRPGQETTVADLSEGQLVFVCAPEGGSAKTIVVLPKKGQKGAPQGAGQEGEGEGGQEGPPPPLGGPQGGHGQGGPQGGHGQGSGE